jgi:type IV pilus assembly protein PilQ
MHSFVLLLWLWLAGGTIDLDVRDADIHDVCRLLADVGHANIVVSDDVHGAVTVRMRHVPWDQALEAIAASKGLRIAHMADVILVLPNAK